MALLEVVKTKSFRCLFCHSDALDELKYGHMYKLKDIVVHYFCMLLSKHIRQKGQDEEGILGFLPNDILAEYKRASRILCSYCGKGGASLECSGRHCSLKFHFTCSTENQVLHQFYETYRSYCKNHRPCMKIDVNLFQDGNMECVICLEGIDILDKFSFLRTPCCRKKLLHTQCVQRMAVNAGYLLKCPYCNDTELFRKGMLTMGIYIPDQDASWEMEPNAFEELLEPYSHCDAVDCLCKQGREYNSSGRKWKIIRCHTCGSSGIHLECMPKFSARKQEWNCPTCLKVMLGKKKLDRIQSRFEKQILERQQNYLKKAIFETKHLIDCRKRKSSATLATSSSKVLRTFIDFHSKGYDAYRLYVEDNVTLKGIRIKLTRVHATSTVRNKVKNKSKKKSNNRSQKTLFDFDFTTSNSKSW